MRSLFLGTAALGVIALAAASSPARAAFINGSAWETTNAQAEAATPATIATLGPASFTFTASGIAFSSFGNSGNTGNPSADYTFGSFLSSLGALTSSTATAAQNATLLSDGSATGAMFEFTGTAAFTHGQTFTVTHDDGVDLFVNGVNVLNSPGPHSPETETFTYAGATGNFGFDFVYGECCGAPAVFETTLVPPTPAPEPASLALLGAGLVGFGLIRRRRSS